MPSFQVNLTDRQDAVLTYLANQNSMTKADYGQGIIDSFFENQIRGYFRSIIENMTEAELVTALGELDYIP